MQRTVVFKKDPEKINEFVIELILPRFSSLSLYFLVRFRGSICCYLSGFQFLYLETYSKAFRVLPNNMQLILIYGAWATCAITNLLASLLCLLIS